MFLNWAAIRPMNKAWAERCELWGSAPPTLPLAGGGTPRASQVPSLGSDGCRGYFLSSPKCRLTMRCHIPARLFWQLGLQMRRLFFRSISIRQEKHTISPDNKKKKVTIFLSKAPVVFLFSICIYIFLKATLFRQTDVQLHHREIGKRQEADFSLFKGEGCRPLNGTLLLFFLVVVVERGTCQEKWAAGDFRQVWVSVWIYSDAGAFSFFSFIFSNRQKWWNSILIHHRAALRKHCYRSKKQVDDQIWRIETTIQRISL